MPKTTSRRFARSVRWPRRGRAWIDAWQRSQEPNVVLVHYRDLTSDTEGQLRSLAARLGIDVSEDRLPLLAQAVTFDAMKDRAAWLAPDRLGVLKDPDSFVRAGRSGEGEKILDDADRQRYELRITELTSPEIRQWLHHGSTASR